MAKKPAPSPKLATSCVETQNLSMRMGMRRFTRLTNGFSKKVENHAFVVALFCMHYNFCRVHKTLRVTPAMEAGLTDHIWTIEECLLRMASKKWKRPDSRLGLLLLINCRARNPTVTRECAQCDKLLSNKRPRT